MTKPPRRAADPFFLGIQEVLKFYPGGRSSLLNDQTFPKSIKLRNGRNCWIASEVIAWRDALIASRDKVPEGGNPSYFQKGDAPKRPRGRPRKNPPAAAASSDLTKQAPPKPKPKPKVDDAYIDALVKTKLTKHQSAA